MIEGSCHCGAVHYRYDATPAAATSCNCSICRRLGVLWIYAPVGKITITGATETYMRGEKNLGFHSCPTCHCTTHWAKVSGDDPDAKMAVNLRLADPAVMDAVPVRRFDGADTWEFLD